MNWNEAFIVRPAGLEEEKYMITLGNKLATEELFETREAAEEKIKNKDWNLIASLCVAISKTEVNE